MGDGHAGARRFPSIARSSSARFVVPRVRVRCRRTHTSGPATSSSTTARRASSSGSTSASSSRLSTPPAKTEAPARCRDQPESEPFGNSITGARVVGTACEPKTRGRARPADPAGETVLVPPDENVEIVDHPDPAPDAGSVHDRLGGTLRTASRLSRVAGVPPAGARRRRASGLQRVPRPGVAGAAGRAEERPGADDVAGASAEPERAAGRRARDAPAARGDGYRHRRGDE